MAPKNGNAYTLLSDDSDSDASIVSVSPKIVPKSSTSAKIAKFGSIDSEDEVVISTRKRKPPTKDHRRSPLPGDANSEVDDAHEPSAEPERKVRAKPLFGTIDSENTPGRVKDLTVGSSIAPSSPS
ncbi:hypothetical protein MPER_11158, partial [Moniliophthora perniciosa FA553]